MQENILKEIRNSKVEWKELWEVTIWNKKYVSVEKSKQKKVSKYSGFLAKELKELASENGDIKILTTNKTNLWTKKDLAGNKVHKGEIIAIPNGGNAIIQYYKGEFVTSNDNCIASSSDEKILNNKYLYYFLLNNLALLESFYRGSGIKHPNMSEVLNIKIPLPSLELQNKIVEILDKFSQATSELQKELKKENELRKKQYEFYREKLLSFGDEVEWKSLSEIALKINSGGTPKTDIEEYYNGNIPWLRTQEVNFCPIYDTEIKITELGLKNSSAKIIPANCVIIAMYGATVGKIAINKIPMATNQACANIQVNDKIANYRYVFYFLSKEYEYIKSLGAGSQTNINAGIVKKLKIPIPSIEKQQEIVNILDKFETLTNSITEGLPKEIELRQKQYEYYRNLLLSFKE